MPSRSAVLPVVLVALAAVLSACSAAPESAGDPLPDPPTSSVEDPADDSGPGGAPAPSPPGPDGPADPPPVRDPTLDVALRLTEVARMDAPIAGAVGPDGVLHLASRTGTVHRLTDDGLGPPVLDLRDETTTSGERGLLGLAFAADGTELYLSFTDLTGASIVEAIALDADGAVLPARRRTLLRVPQPQANHNGGDVRVGPDGLLYVALGDGGGAGDPQGAAQDRSSLLGSLLRLDPRAQGASLAAADNPFVGVTGAADEIYAYGLRNPWRFSFDGDVLWIADVGQGTREEINRVPLDDASGANFGWNLMEGTRTFAGDEPPDHLPPIHEYATSGARCAVAGGHVYRGQAIPDLRGVYLFSDTCEGLVRGLIVDADGVVLDEGPLGIGADIAVGFAADASGETYVLDLTGSVWRIDPA